MKTAAPLPAGTLLANGRYQLQQVLGQGGFAITYLALDIQLKRTVAIKELCPQGCIRDAHNQVAPITLPPDQFAQIRQRFVEEAQLVAQLSHPGIVRIYDVFQQNNTGYMVMEYLHGETLGAKLRRAGGVLPVADAVDYILKVCDALEVVHRAGYIHRDIKPDNIIHCEDGRLVLIDFGAARHFVANQTATYTVMLTPSYAAPEQYSSAGRLDPRTDIYGLAATLYHLVTGVPPLPALDRTSGLDLPPPHSVEPKVGEALSRAIQQGLSMRMDERPASVEEFAELIDEAFEEDLQPDDLDDDLDDDLVDDLEESSSNSFWKSRLEEASKWLGNAFFMLSLGAVGLTAWIVLGYVRVPQVIGKPLEKVNRILREADLKAEVILEDYNEQYLPGVVYSVSPSEGRIVRKGSKVYLRVSKGSRFVQVPNVRNLTESRARRELESLGLVVMDAVEERYDAEIPKGFVIGTVPPAGTRVDRSQPIQLILSIGSQPVPLLPEEALMPIPHNPQPQPPVGQQRLFEVQVDLTNQPNRSIRIEVEDARGTHTVFDETRAGGQVHSIFVETHGSWVIIRVYVDNELVQEIER